MSSSELEKIIHLSNGKKNKEGVIRFIHGIHKAVIAVFGDDEEIYDECLINLAAHTLAIYCGQYKESDELRSELLTELDNIIPKMIEEAKKNIDGKNTQH